jgi:hypothetical protein
VRRSAGTLSSLKQAGQNSSVSGSTTVHRPVGISVAGGALSDGNDGYSAQIGQLPPVLDERWMATPMRTKSTAPPSLNGVPS